MSELNHLVFQPIDPTSDDDDIPDGHRQSDDDIELNEQIDESSLENYWEQVVEDIHQDPDWFTFADE
jgi:hypothetical protein